MRIENRFAIITGAAVGIDRAIAELFAREGAKVALINMDEKSVCSVTEAIS